MVFHSAIQLEIARQLHQHRLSGAESPPGPSVLREPRPGRKEAHIHPARRLPAFLRGALRSKDVPAYHLELDRPFVIRESRAGDKTALERLAQLDSRTLPEGSFLLAEIHGEVVAAAPLDVDEEPLSDPFRPTANLRQLLRLQARYERRHRDRAVPAPGAANRALEDVA
jgi:hypothetical protein